MAIKTASTVFQRGLLLYSFVLVPLLAASNATINATNATNATSSNSFNRYGIQSTDIASSYAAGAVYDSELHRLYVTGSTYGHYFDSTSPLSLPPRNESDCFLGILQLPVPGMYEEAAWIQRTVIGTPGVQDACSALQVVGRGQQSRIYLLGHARNFSGALSPLEHDNNENETEAIETKVYGTILDLSWDGKLQGGYLLSSDMVQYPVSVDVVNSHDLIVASLHSNNTNQDKYYSSWMRLQPTDRLDTTTAGGYIPPQFGSRFRLFLNHFRSVQSNITNMITKDTFSAIRSRENDGDRDYEGRNQVDGPSERGISGDLRDSFSSIPLSLTSRSSQDIESTLQSLWQKDVTTDEDVSIQVSAVKKLSESQVLVIGSTTGTGSFFGNSGGKTNGMMKGFLTVIHPQTSTVMLSTQLSSGGNDKILGVCTHESSDIYIVGMTDGSLLPETVDPPSLVRSGYFQAFLRKIDAVTLQTYWTYQLGGLHEFEFAHVHGISCAVTPDGSQVYMAGNVKNGAVVSSNGTYPDGYSAGQDDVFITQLDARNGTVLYTKQLGTVGDDMVANGNSLIADKYGNAVLLLNTRGSFLMDKQFIRDDVSDVVVVSFDKDDGSHLPIVENQAYLEQQAAVIYALQATKYPANEPSDTAVEATIAATYVGTDAPNTFVDTNSYSDSVHEVPELLSDPLSSVFPTDEKLIHPVGAYTIHISPDRSQTRTLVIASILVANLVVVGIVVILISRRRRMRKPRGVRRYINEHRNDNLHVMKSATGGYKVAYADPERLHIDDDDNTSDYLDDPFFHHINEMPSKSYDTIDSRQPINGLPLAHIHDSEAGSFRYIFKPIIEDFHQELHTPTGRLSTIGDYGSQSMDSHDPESIFDQLDSRMA